MAKDFTSSKLYIKGTIWIGEILFGEIEETWNYILDILDEIQKSKVAKYLGHQFIIFAEKIRDGYKQFSDLIKHT